MQTFGIDVVAIVAVTVFKVNKPQSARTFVLRLSLDAKTKGHACKQQL